MDRYALGKAIGVSDRTVQAVELGNQNLGRAARKALERLTEHQTDAATSQPAVAAKPTMPPAGGDHALAESFAFALDPANLARAQEISRVAECSVAEALAFLWARRPRATR